MISLPFSPHHALKYVNGTVGNFKTLNQAGKKWDFALDPAYAGKVSGSKVG